MSIVQILLGGFLVLLFHVINVFVLKPRSLRAKLQRQGIHGPSPHFLLGNIPEIKRLKLDVHESIATTKDKDDDDDVSISHTWPSIVFPHLLKWRKQYGPTFLFYSGKIQWLLISDIEIVKQIIMYTSLDLGKPSFLSKDRAPLFGQGIFSSSGPLWAYHRKIISPELYTDKVKGMVNLIAESTNILIRSWETRLQSGGEVLEIKIDEDLRSFSADVIARACFGSNYIEGKEIFTKLRDLQKVMSTIEPGIPGFRYLPVQKNREIWRLEKEINSKLLKLIKQRLKETEEQDLLHMIFEGAKNCEGSESTIAISHDRFMIDNCKAIFFAGYETSAISAAWVLMLLAIHQDWQDRVRAEVVDVCGTNPPDATMLRSLKKLNMVIQETLRLYPPSSILSREAFQDINLKGLQIPKGMHIQIPVPILQQDPDLWGPDAHKFNPDRFSNGVFGACNFPQAYMPFGIGPRICLGQHLAMTELKVFLSLVLMKFRFSLSSSYLHSPTWRLIIEPGHGVVLKITRI